MWYYRKEGKELGPVGEDEVRELLKKKAITGYTGVRSAASENWSSLFLSSLAPLLAYVPEDVAPEDLDVRADKFGRLLLLLCAMLIFARPLITTLRLISFYELAFRLLAESPGVMVIVVTDTCLSVGVVVFGIFAGIRLYKLRPNALIIAKSYLFATIFHAVVVSALAFLPLIRAMSARAVDEVRDFTLYGVFWSAAFFGVWYTYLFLSRRVRQTYGT